MEDTQPRHGGDTAFATARYGAPYGGWMDLSTGINPVPYPAVVGSLTELPRADDLARLIAAARDVYGIPSGTGLIAVPGSEAAIRLIPFAAPAGLVAIVGPTYGSHAEAWRNAGRETVEVESVEAIPEDARVAVICNPNNPDGRTTSPELLVMLSHRMGARSGLLIVDAAFADVVPDFSLTPYLQFVPIVVLRSFGKFYGLPGLRLGFVAGAPKLVDRVATLFGDWPVSSPAIAIGTAALSDGKWRATTQERLAEEAARLREVLQRHRLTIKGGTDLFTLIEDDDAIAIHEGLARQGIWTRAFASHPSWLRLGLPPDTAGLARLDRALSDLR